MSARPEQVDRRQEITDAFCRITIRGGLGSATFREVATEAGVSAGLVQHYFGTRQHLLLAALQELIDRVSRRLFDRIASLGAKAPSRAVVGAVLEEFLPIDNERREVALLFIGFHAASLTDPRIAAADGIDFPNTIALAFTKELKRAQRDGQLAPGIEPDLAGKALVTLIIGLGHLVPIGTYSHDDGQSLIDYTLDRLFV